jgi:predicted porin
MMNRNFCFIAALTFSAWSGVIAQTPATAPPANPAASVSLYGVLDVSAYEKQLAGERRLKTLQSGAMTTSRWGLSGSEDLGGGLRAVFDFSSFIRVDTGAAGRNDADPFFARLAFVGLASERFGSIRLGRIPTATFVSEIGFGAFLDSTNLGPYVLHTFQSPGTQPMITGNGFLDSAWGNSVAYSLPVIAALPGLTASVQVAASEGSGGQRIGGGTTYRSDAFGATFTFDSVDHGTLSVGAPTAATATLARPVYSADKISTYQGGAYGDFHAVRFWAQANQTTFSRSAASDLRLRTCALSATVPFGPSNLIAEWAHTNQDRAGLARISRETGAVGYDYLLSKRSDVYAVLLHDKVTNLHGGTGVAAGLRHRF